MRITRTGQCPKLSNKHIRAVIDFSSAIENHLTKDDVMSQVTSVSEFIDNRAGFAIGELEKHDGNWVAFSPDGTMVVASSKKFDEIDQLVVNAGYDPEEVYLERIVFGDTSIGGAELH